MRQHLALVALGKQPADCLLRVGRLLEVHSGLWLDDQEIVIAGRRIAYVGPLGSWRGEAAERIAIRISSAVPGFGEVHKHIESTHLTPEFEAALVLPRGNTWTCEASHEFANVNGASNTEFWQKARLAGSPLKIFIQPGSAVPPSAWEESGGWYGYDEQKRLPRRRPVGDQPRRGDGLAVGVEPGQSRLRRHVGHDRRHLRDARRGRGPRLRPAPTRTTSPPSPRPG